MTALADLLSRSPWPISSLPPYFLAFLVLLPLLLPLCLRLVTPRSIPGIPAYPNPKPLLGDIPRLVNHIGRHNSISAFFDQVSKDLGPIAQVRVGPFQKLIVLTDYVTVEHLLLHSKTLDRDKQTIAVFRSILPLAQITLRTGDMWKHHRRIIGTAMTSKYLSLTTPRANESVGALIQLWREKMRVAGDGKGWEAESDMESATMEAICGIAFGVSWGILPSLASQITSDPSITKISGPEVIFSTVRPPLAESTWKVFESVAVASSWPALSHFMTRLTPSYRHHWSHLRNFLKDRLKASRERANAMGAEVANEHADNTLDLMVAREMRGDWMSDNEMLDEVFQYLVAGTETSGVTLSWWLKYMTNDPAVQRKLRSHLLSRLPEIEDRPPRFEELNAHNTPYLEAVVHETLRMSRTAGGYTREVMEDTVVLGHVLPKGTIIVVPTSLGMEDLSTPIYRMPDPASTSVDEEKKGERLLGATALDPARPGAAERKVGRWAAGTAKDFDPERWLNDKGEFDINRGPSLPFSLGQRGCFGKNLALLELRLFMSQLNLAFFFAPIPEDLNTYAAYDTVARHPKKCFIRPVSWDSDEARAGEEVKMEA